jgi:hypothetical protein
MALQHPRAAGGIKKLRYPLKTEAAFLVILRSRDEPPEAWDWLRVGTLREFVAVTWGIRVGEFLHRRSYPRLYGSRRTGSGEAAPQGSGAQRGSGDAFRRRRDGRRSHWRKTRKRLRPSRPDPDTTLEGCHQPRRGWSIIGTLRSGPHNRCGLSRSANRDLSAFSEHDNQIV